MEEQNCSSITKIQKAIKGGGHCCLVWFALCFSQAYRFKNAILNKICLSCQLITQVELFN